jgi:16S rRNA (adenine1518-N6/adenine1519-N6)-dimethyltransferase
LTATGGGRHLPRKRFGQHFLADQGVIRSIVEAIAPREDDLMAEIGPGLGAITRPLSAQLRHLHVVEIDRDIAARLRAEHDPAKVTVHEADALRFDFGALGHGLRLVGNLPYNISTPLLFHVGADTSRLRDCHFMLQREVVERMVAEPGGGEYGRLSVMLQYRFAMERIIDVSPDAFRPPPRVQSAVVRMIPVAPEVVADDHAMFSELVRRAFTQRRKTLRNAVGGLLDEAGLAEAGLDPGDRPETIAVAGFVRAANVALRSVERHG